MVTTHAEHQCKECQEKCSSFMELLKHISKQHCKEKDGSLCEDDEIGNKKDTEEKGDTNSSAVINESRLDEFLMKKI